MLSGVFAYALALKNDPTNIATYVITTSISAYMIVVALTIASKNKQRIIFSSSIFKIHIRSINSSIFCFIAMLVSFFLAFLIGDYFDITEGLHFFSIIMMTFGIQFLAFRSSTWRQFNDVDVFWKYQAFSVTIRILVLIIFFQNLSFITILIANLIATTSLTLIHLKTDLFKLVYMLRKKYFLKYIFKARFSIDGLLRTFIGYIDQTIPVLLIILIASLGLINDTEKISLLAVIPFVLAINHASRSIFYKLEISYIRKSIFNNSYIYVLFLGLIFMVILNQTEPYFLKVFKDILNLTDISAYILYNFIGYYAFLYPITIGFLSIEALDYHKLKNFFYTLFLSCALIFSILIIIYLQNISDILTYIILVIPISIAISVRKIFYK